MKLLIPLFLAGLSISSVNAQLATTVTMPGGYTGLSSISITFSAEAMASLNIYIQQVIAPVSGGIILGAAATSGATSVTLSSGTGVTVGMGLLINGDASLVTAISGATATVTRGTLGTTAAAHSLGDAVIILRNGDIATFVKASMGDLTKRIMLQTPGPVIAGDQTSIAAAIAAAVN